MADHTQRQTHGVLGDVKSALKGVKGAGDGIRGAVNESIDTAFHQNEGVAKNKAIKDKGVAEMENTDAHFTKHQGVGSTATTGQHSIASTANAPIDQHHIGGSHGAGPTGGVTGGLARNTQLPDGTSTGAGAHSGAVGNLGSSVPQQGLGGEPEGARERY